MTYQYRTDPLETAVPRAAQPFSIRPSLYRAGGKRVADLILAMILLLPFAAATLILALAIVVSGHAPFYWQARVGKNGKVFRMWKLRTMVNNAESVLEAYLSTSPEARQEWDRHQKLTDDPRITTVGRFLRASSLDELPQLWNVVRGDMSFVGPRPMMTSQQVLYPGTEYYAMHPGITGFWQISERNETSFQERAGYDQRYFREMSLVTDLRILARTVVVVLTATGR